MAHFYASPLMRSLLFRVNHLLALTHCPKIEPWDVWDPLFCLNLVRAPCFRLDDSLLCRSPDTKRAPLKHLLTTLEHCTIKIQKTAYTI